MQSRWKVYSFKVVLIGCAVLFLMRRWNDPVVLFLLQNLMSLRLLCVTNWTFFGHSKQTLISQRRLFTLLSYRRLSIVFRSCIDIRIVRIHTSIWCWRYSPVYSFSRCCVSTSPNCDRMGISNDLDVLLAHLFDLDTLLINVTVLIAEIGDYLMLELVTTDGKLVSSCWIEIRKL